MVNAEQALRWLQEQDEEEEISSATSSATVGNRALQKFLVIVIFAGLAGKA
jgi:hypothetical protein